MTSPAGRDPDRPRDGWGQTSHYGRGLVTVEPRMFTEREPVPSVAIPEWQHPSADEWAPTEAAQWSPTTYVGRRRRPAGRRTPPAAPPRDAPAAPVRDKGLLASSRTMAVATLVSRITGFVRNALLVAALGTAVHGVGDAYNVANNFPNQVYELLLGGVLASVLIPLLVHAQEHDEDGGESYAQRLVAVAVTVLAAVTLLAVLAAPLISAGFVHNAAQRGLTTTFATLLLPEIFFYGLFAVFTAVLNVRHVYGPGAWAPVVNNVIVIATVALFWALPGPKSLTPSTMTTAQVLVIGIGTTLGIAGQALMLMPFLRRVGFTWRWRFRALPNEAGRMREAGAMAGWVLGYVVASQIGVTVIAVVGVARGGFTIFTQTDLLFQMPYGILVVSLLTALMPRLSRHAARGETTAVVDDMGLGARLSALALLPITAGFIALGPAFTTVLFAHGRTTLSDARLMGTSLAVSAFGLLPFALVMLQLRVFYAMRDARTPTLINVFMVASKVCLVLVADATITDRTYLVWALNGSTSASYLVGAAVGHVLLTRRFGHLGFRRVGQTALRAGIASALGAAAAYAVVVGTQHALGHGRLGALCGLIAGSVLGLLVLAAVLWRTDRPELRELVQTARR